MNKRIRKKKMKQYAKQHGINLNAKIEPLLEDNRNLIALCYGCTVVPPKPTLHIDHI